jgi:cell wall-associated NlpC family hydrolase
VTWYAAYVGIPYQEKNCWQLIQLIFAEQWGVTLPDFDVTVRGTAIDTIFASGIVWQAVDPQAVQIGDVVAITGGRYVRHVGLVVAPGVMLHSQDGTDSVIESYESFVWRQRVGGFYRHPHFARRRR